VDAVQARSASVHRAERAARWGIGLWVLLWVLNDALPYVGGRDDSCQTMFSSLEWGVGPDGRAWNNHLLVPQAMWLDAWIVLELEDVRIEGAPIDARDRSLAGWIERDDRARSLEAVRVVIGQLCDRHDVALRYRRHWPRPSGEWGAARAADPFVHVSDACADPFLSSPAWWVPVRRYETDFPLPPAAETNE
jgi:hypothetical protein